MIEIGMMTKKENDKQLGSLVVELHFNSNKHLFMFCRYVNGILIRSARGVGTRIFDLVTRVRIPYGLHLSVVG